MFSILPAYTILIFGFLFLIISNARHNNLEGKEISALNLLLVALLLWTAVLVFMGIHDIHLNLALKFAFLWQAFIPVTIWMTALVLFPSARTALDKLSFLTPAHWLTWIQVLRIGAIGGITKGLTGVIHSNYVYWIGIPDFLFGCSAVVMSWLVMKEKVSSRALMIWNLTGFSIVFVPSFIPFLYWMNEPGFLFIFDFPMVLAPGIAVSILLSLNLLQAWASWRAIASSRKEKVMTV